MMKIVTSLFLVLVLGHCSSVPKPPHCKDNSRGLKPVNHSTISNESKGDK